MLQRLALFASLARERWAGLSGPQRGLIASFTAVLLIAIALASVFASRPRYAVLFSNLDPTDAGEITAKLREQKIPYRLSSGGRAIEVPADRVYDVRLDLASQGLPQGGSVGFELFDKYNFGMTDFAQQLNYRRAIQGELERTISQLSGVEQARVHLVIPQDRLFQNERQNPSASVVLKLRTGAAPSEEEVSAVVHLVSAAVEGLKPESVTVVDTRGRVLAGGLARSGDEGATAVLTGTALKLQQQYEQHLQDELQSMLDRAFGIGKAVVRVRAEMDFASRETQRETVQPAGSGSNTGVLLSRERVEETYTGAPPAAGGVPGTASNLRPTSLAVGARGTGSYSRTEESENYQVSKSVERIREAPGSVKRLSIGVLVDGSLTSRQRTDIENMISAACGLDTTRGDRVTVASLPFDRKSLQADQADMQRERRQQMYLAYARIGAAVLVMLLFLLLARSALRGRPEPSQEIAALPTQTAEAAAEELAPQSGLLLESAEPAEPSEQPRPHRHIEITDTPVRRLALENPEEVAQLIRTWLLEQTPATSRR
ncbi:MAG: flagellar basal-body MS-ring/collar protein FliF [Armatimonadota bacterium]